MPFVIEFSGIPDVASTEAFKVNVFLDLYPVTTLATARRIAALRNKTFLHNQRGT